MQISRQKRIVIAGGGTAGWSAAALLSNLFGKVFEIILVESDEIGTVGVGEATIPTIRKFHELAGIDEDDFMRATNATFKLGINFENWSQEGVDYFHSFGTTGIDHWSSGFQHFWLGAKGLGNPNPYHIYSFESIAAAHNKFSRQYGLSYAYHLDSGLYGKFLRSLSEKRGVARLEGKIEKVNLAPQTGEIASLHLADGRLVNGDIFIDCTGFRALLIGEALGIGYDDWSDLLMCDRAIAFQTELKGEQPPFTRSVAHSAGWRWQIPLQHRVGNGFIYCSHFMDDDSAYNQFFSDLNEEPISKPNFIKFRTGVRKQQWYKNCIAIGLSAGFLEPLESTSIHLIHFSLSRLIRLLSLGETPSESIREYNNLVEKEALQARDFLLLHYWVNQKDNPFWKECQNLNVPESLRHRVALFEQTGSVFRNLEDLFTENSWIQVMLGQGIMPKSVHPKVYDMSETQILGLLEQISRDIGRKVGLMPGHSDYLKAEFESVA